MAASSSSAVAVFHAKSSVDLAKQAFAFNGPLGSSMFSSTLKTTPLRFQKGRARPVSSKIYAAAVVSSDVGIYTLPSWADFEIGRYPVYWSTTAGGPPVSGQLYTVYYNYTATNIKPNEDYGFAFNGGFNQPIMCGGEPRVMTKRERGASCTPFYTIKINVPIHARTLEFSFTNGEDWDGPYKLVFEIPPKLRNKPMSFFNEGLAKELSEAGACEGAIYPEAVLVQDRCVFPSSLIHKGQGNQCELDLVPGCTDKESPFYDPLATVSVECPYVDN